MFLKKKKNRKQKPTTLETISNINININGKPPKKGIVKTYWRPLE